MANWGAGFTNSLPPESGIASVNSSVNTSFVDVIGNKDDTIAGTSLVSLVKNVTAGTGNPPVNSVDSAANVYVGDVIGNKDDTVAGTSIISLEKQILSSVATTRTDISAIAVSVAPILPAISAVAVSVAVIMPALSSIASGISSESPVPTADSADNVYTSDVVGNKTDTVAGNSLVAIGKQILASVTTIRTDISAVAVSVAPILPAVQANGSAIAAVAVSVAPILPAISAVAVSVAAIMPALSSIASAGGGETPVPTADSADNVYTSDVVGNKTDTVAGNSLMSYSKIVVADISSVATSVQAMSSVITSVADFFSVLDAAITSVATSTATLNPAISSVAVSVSSANTTAGQIMTSVSNVIADLSVPAQNSADNVYERDVIGNKTDTSAGNSLYSFAKIFNNYFHVQQRVYPNLATPVAVTAGSVAWTLTSSGFTTVAAAGVITNTFVIDYVAANTTASTVGYQLNIYAGDAGSEVLIGEGSFSPNTYAYCPMKSSVVPSSTRISMKMASSVGGQANQFKLVYHYYN